MPIEPAWRAEVERAFEAHSVDGGGLSLARFIEACRALGCSGAQVLSPPRSRPISPNLAQSRLISAPAAAERPPVLRPFSRASRLSFRQVLSGAPAGRGGGALHAIVQPSPGKGGAAGAGDGGPLLKAALIDSRPLLAAALFVEFDADGSGEVWLSDAQCVHSSLSACVGSCVLWALLVSA